MGRFLARRLLYNAFVLVGVAVVVHALVLLSGDPARAILPVTAPPELVASVRQHLGLDQPPPVQFALFLGRALTADFGDSTRFGVPALQVVLERVPPTLLLALLGLLISLGIALPLGTAAALRRGTWIDAGARTIAAIGQAVPNFVLAQILILVFAVTLRALPVSGIGTPAHLVMPGLVVGFASSAGLVRILRSALLEVYSREYIRTAFAKGLSERRVLLRHALRNAAIPVVTWLAFDVAGILSGIVIVERVFQYPGMGLLAFQAIANRDLPVIQAVVFLSGLAIVTTNMLLDVAYSRLDPRIRMAP